MVIFIIFREKISFCWKFTVPCRKCMGNFNQKLPKMKSRFSTCQTKTKSICFFVSSHSIPKIFSNLRDLKLFQRIAENLAYLSTGMIYIRVQQYTRKWYFFDSLRNLFCLEKTRWTKFYRKMFSNPSTASITITKYTNENVNVIWKKWKY